MYSPDNIQQATEKVITALRKRQLKEHSIHQYQLHYQELNAYIKKWELTSIDESTLLEFLRIQYNVHIPNLHARGFDRNAGDHIRPLAMRTLLAQPFGNTREGFRDMVLLSVLYDTGARVQELVDIRIKHIRLEKPAVVILHGKGNKTRQVPIMPNTVNLLRSYLASYKGNPGFAHGENPLFFNRRGEPLSRWGVSHIIDKYVKRAQANGELCVGFPITPHTFRHSKAMHARNVELNIWHRDFLLVPPFCYPFHFR